MSEQLYKFVKYDPANPPKDGWVHTINEGKPEMAQFRAGYGFWNHQGQRCDESKIEYLSPVSIEPESGVLRKALEEIRHHLDTWSDEPQRAVRLVGKIVDKALSSSEVKEDNMDALMRLLLKRLGESGLEVSQSGDVIDNFYKNGGNNITEEFIKSIKDEQQK